MKLMWLMQRNLGRRWKLPSRAYKNRGKPIAFEPEQLTPVSTLRHVGRSDSLQVMTFKMSNQRRALQAVQMLRQAGYTDATIDHTRPVELEVLVDVPLRIQSQADVERLVRGTDPESALFALRRPDLPGRHRLAD